MSSMESFYGGRQGASFVIVKKFDGIDIPDNTTYRKGWFAKDNEDYFIVPLIERTGNNYANYPYWGAIPRDGLTTVTSKTGVVSTPLDLEYAEGMKQCFEKAGASTSEVNYGEYVIIDTISGVGEYANPDNGKIFRRGMDYDNELAGAEFIGQITGPKGDAGPVGQQGPMGPAPNITATATADVTSSGTPTVNVTRTGTQEAPIFSFAFHGLKGPQGETGEQGPQGLQGETGATGEAGADGAPGRDVTSIQMTGTGRTHPIIATYSDGQTETIGTIKDGEDGSGSGDMSRSTYDVNHNGYVDAAAALTDGINSHTYTSLNTVLNGKQNLLTFDNTPTENSTNPVTSNGIYQALQHAASSLDELSDVEISSPATGQYIKFDGTKWVNATGGGGGTGDMEASTYDPNDDVSGAGGIPLYVAGEIDDALLGLAPVASSGSYIDLVDKPSIPSKTSDLTNDSGFLSSVPIAAQNVLGGVKVGSGLSITAEGVLSATGGGGGSSALFYVQPLTAGSTSVTFTNLPSTSNYIANFYTSNGANYINMDNSVSGQVTLTYEVQSDSILVYLRLEEIVTS